MWPRDRLEWRVNLIGTAVAFVLAFVTGRLGPAVPYMFVFCIASMIWMQVRRANEVK
jgi:hypothetical protein